MTNQMKKVEKRNELQARLNKILNNVLPYPKELDELEELVEKFEGKYKQEVE